jgi:hypothetical protein
MGDVKYLPTADLPVERIINGAIEEGLVGIVICGQTKEGKLFTATSYADGRFALWDLEMCRRRMLANHEKLAPD